jgi:hypothetical protein
MQKAKDVWKIQHGLRKTLRLPLFAHFNFNKSDFWLKEMEDMTKIFKRRLKNM